MQQRIKRVVKMNKYQQLIQSGISGYHIGKLALIDDYEHLEPHERDNDRDGQIDDEQE